MRSIAITAALLLLPVSTFAQSGPSVTGSYAFLATAKQYDSLAIPAAGFSAS